MKAIFFDEEEQDHLIISLEVIKCVQTLREIVPRLDEKGTKTTLKYLRDSIDQLEDELQKKTD